MGSDRGQVIAYVNGQRFTGDPRSIPLDVHAVIRLNTGSYTAKALHLPSRSVRGTAVISTGQILEQKHSHRIHTLRSP